MESEDFLKLIIKDLTNCWGYIPYKNKIKESHIYYYEYSFNIYEYTMTILGKHNDNNFILVFTSFDDIRTRIHLFRENVTENFIYSCRDILNTDYKNLCEILNESLKTITYEKILDYLQNVDTLENKNIKCNLYNKYNKIFIISRNNYNNVLKNLLITNKVKNTLYYLCTIKEYTGNYEDKLLEENDYIEESKEICIKCSKEHMKKDLKYCKLIDIKYNNSIYFIICDTCC